MVDQTAQRSAGPRDAAGGSPTSSMLGGTRYQDTALSAVEQGSTAVEGDNPQRLYRHHVDDARLRHLCGHLHQLGPRAVYEFIREIRAGGDVVQRLVAYKRLDPGILSYLGADRLPVTEVRQ
jgi:hypothetical protein